MIITLTTDFGLRDAFVGVMKGVILSIAPAVEIVDLSHDVSSFCVVEAAYLIADSCAYFPSGTIHVVIVDPGVGSSRRPLALQARVDGAIQTFVAPDNGVLSRIEDVTGVRHITNSALFLQPVSQTFHGRDVFVPVAAQLAAGLAFDAVGPAIEDMVRLPDLTRPVVLRVDKFGNVITNLRRAQLGAGFAIRANGVEVRTMRSSYDEAASGEVFAIEGSSRRIELAMKQASAAELLNLRPGAEIEVETGTLNQ